MPTPASSERQPATLVTCPSSRALVKRSRCVRTVHETVQSLVGLEEGAHEPGDGVVIRYIQRCEHHVRLVLVTDGSANLPPTLVVMIRERELAAHRGELQGDCLADTACCATTRNAQISDVMMGSLACPRTSRQSLGP